MRAVLHLKLVDHHFRLLQLLQAVAVPALVHAHGLPLGPQHLEVQLNQLQVGRRGGVGLPTQLSLKPVAWVGW